MPRQHGAEMPNHRQPFDEINVVKKLCNEYAQKEAGVGPY